MRFWYVLAFFFSGVITLSPAARLSAQPNASYEDIASSIITKGLAEYRAHTMLTELCLTVGPRLSGSPEAAKAVAWSQQLMHDLGFENVRLEPVMVPRWVRGSVETAEIVRASSGDAVRLNVCALGGSIATPAEGITAEVVEVKSFDELHALGDHAKGKIIFFNRPMDRTKISQGHAYGGAVDQRSQGAVEAAKAGGVAALVRSVTTRRDDVPHTGAMDYADTIPRIPAAAVSILGAETLSRRLAAEGHATVHMTLSCQSYDDVESANVIGEITGSEKPEEIVLIGGHLDSWDKGHGAHDDGTGCIQVIEALRLIKELGLRPKRTIRAVLFMNEENGLRGGKAYGERGRPGERHIVAIETDAGGFSPRGFGASTDSIRFARIARWGFLLDPIDAGAITRGGGGADISELARQGVPVMGMRVDGHRYFDYHHSDNDTIDTVHERELELGAIALAIMSYVLANEGL